MLHQNENEVYIRMLEDIFSPILDAVLNLKPANINFSEISSERFPARNNDIQVSMLGHVLSISVLCFPEIHHMIHKETLRNIEWINKRHFYIVSNIHELSEGERHSLVRQITELLYLNNFGDIYPYEAFIVFLIQLLADKYSDIVLDSLKGNISDIGEWDVIDLHKFLVPSAIHFPNTEVHTIDFRRALHKIEKEIDGYMLFPDIIDERSHCHKVVLVRSNDLSTTLSTDQLIATRIAWNEKGALKNSIPRVYRPVRKKYEQYCYVFRFKDIHADAVDKHELVGEPIVIEDAVTPTEALEMYRETIKEIAARNIQYFQQFIESITVEKCNVFFTSLLAKTTFHKEP